MPLSGAGLTGARLHASLDVRRSQVRDPVTGRMRRLSDEVPVSAELRFQHDPPGSRYSWGVDVNTAAASRSFRLSEAKTFSYAPCLGADLEFRPDRRWRVRLRGQVNGASQTVRYVHAAQRGDGPPVFVERRRTDATAAAYLTVRRTFS